MTTFPGFRPLKANFTTTPNQFFDRILGHYHPCVVTVVGILIRSTLGWEDPDTGERRQEAELALSDFVRPELSRSSARKGIAGAIEAGFIVETMPATNKAPARYALRWDDAEQQKRALQKERRAHGTQRRKGREFAGQQVPKWRKSRGATVTRQTDTPVTVTRLDSAPPINKGVLKKSSHEKKEVSEKVLPPALSEGNSLTAARRNGAEKFAFVDKLRRKGMEQKIASEGEEKGGAA